MQVNLSGSGHVATARPWYSYRWPWFLSLGPIAVILAGIPTAWLAFSRADALVVDDYYKQGKAINQDLRRARVAAALGIQIDLSYEPAQGKLIGTVRNLSSVPDAIVIRLVHPTQPAKDRQLAIQPDAAGKFAMALPMLERARWHVAVDSARGDWRVKDVWMWPEQPHIAMRAQ